MKDSIKDYLVACDVDGTLLVAGYGIPAENIDAIEAFTEKGGYFTLCTSRNLESVTRFSDWLNITAPVILDSGNYIYDLQKKEIIYEDTLSSPEALIVAENILEMFPNMGLEVTVEPTVYIPVMNEYTDKYSALHHIRYIMCDINDVPSGWHKAALIGSPQDAMAARKYAYIQESVNDAFSEFDYVISAPGVLEIIQRGNAKSQGINTLCGHMGIATSNVIAIGDSAEDRDMLIASGLKVAVGNASADVRALCDITVRPCTKGGVAEVLNLFNDLVNNYEQTSLDI